MSMRTPGRVIETRMRPDESTRHTDSMSATLTARGVRVSHGAHVVLAGVDLVVAPGHRIGVVGPNGVGKSTLLRVLAGELAPDDGTVVRAPADAAVVHLRQEPDLVAAESLLDHLARRTGVAGAARHLEEVTARL